MTDTPRWRTVEAHGQPADDDLPVLYEVFYGLVKHRVLHEKGLDFGQHTRWMPVAELLTLPDAPPPPPRKVTIELDEDTARRIVGYSWAPGTAFSRAAAACHDALAKLDGHADA